MADVAKSLMQEAERRHGDFRRNSMLSAVESEEARQDVDIQMRAMNNMARRDSIGFNGMYGRHGYNDPLTMGMMNTMGFGGLGLGMGLGLGSAANALAFESQLAPFGGIGLGGLGSYGMSQYDLAAMAGAAPIMGMGPYGVTPLGYNHSPLVDPLISPYHPLHHHRRRHRHAALVNSMALNGGFLPTAPSLLNAGLVNPLLNPLAAAPLASDYIAGSLIGGVF